MDQAELAAFKEFVSREAPLLEKTIQDDLAEALSSCDPKLGEVLEYAIFSGGKRIRPLLAVLSARVSGKNDSDLYSLAAAFEYLHVATLVHDDVIDHAATRRGRDSVVKRFGLAEAILAGDWLHARAMNLVGRYAGREGLEIFCRSTTGMVDGEFLQLRYVADPEVSEKQYFAVIHRKTALLISSTCEIGAVYGGAEPEQQEALSGYGTGLGTAFQIIDDQLDYLGDTGTTGKKTGNDFVEGKMTLPVIRAMSTAGPEDRVLMGSLLTGDRSNPDNFKQFLSLVQKNRGFDSARQSADRLVQEALAAVEIFDTSADPHSLAMLRALGAYVLSRNR